MGHTNNADEQIMAGQVNEWTETNLVCLTVSAGDGDAADDDDGDDDGINAVIIC